MRCRTCSPYGGFQPSIPGQSPVISLGILGIGVLTQPRYASPGIAVLTQGGYGRIRHGYGAEAKVVTSKPSGGEGKDATSGKPSTGDVILGLASNIKETILGVTGAPAASETPAFDTTVPQNTPAPTSYVGPLVSVAGIGALAIGAIALLRK